MSRQVNYHLARARAAASGASGAARCPVASCVDALVRTLLKLYAGRALEISSTVAPDLCARVQREDLDEILGNVMDNACKWASSRVVLEASQKDALLVFMVDDDGPGLAPASSRSIGTRGPDRRSRAGFRVRLSDGARSGRTLRRIHHSW
jgi:signal transduction histidine kinase